MNGRLQTEKLDLKVIELANQVNDRIELTWEGVHEILDVPFEISDGIVLPAGDYRYSLHGFRLQASNGRKLSGEFEFSRGDFWNGTVSAYEGFVEFRPSPHFFAGVNYEVVDAQLPQGAFDFAITRLNLDLNLTPRMTWQNLVQHNSVSKTVGWNSRLRWEVQPGNIWFLVLNQGWEIEEGSYMPVNTGFTSKCAGPSASEGSGRAHSRRRRWSSRRLIAVGSVSSANLLVPSVIATPSGVERARRYSDPP